MQAESISVSTPKYQLSASTCWLPMAVRSMVATVVCASAYNAATVRAIRLDLPIWREVST
jgi:hypothetical protein